MMKLFAVAVFAALAIAQPQPADVIRAALNSYLAAYEPQLSELIADEFMEQRNVRGDSRGGGGVGPPEFRTLKSEVAFIALPGDAGWMGFRRVLKVGNTAVDGAPASLSTALTEASRDDYTRARAMLAESAKYNIGAPRTTNLPNLPLELLHSRHAHRFTARLAGEERVRGKRAVKLVLVEKISPTIIRAFDGSDMQSMVVAYVEAGTGRLWRTDAITRDPRDSQWSFQHVVSVEFKEERKLNLLVPASMHEEFFAGQNRKGTSDATYENYRRFQTAARIVPQ